MGSVGSQTVALPEGGGAPLSEPARGVAIPSGWKRYFVPQRHGAYTPVEHATWRRLLTRTAALVGELQRWLHPAYIEGFRQLILPWTRIPRLSEVNAMLAEFGWQTVCVEGYLPPEVYSGLLARGILPVARSIRRLEHSDFSPTPDLAHDLLGHLPMLIAADYQQYLRRLAEAMAVAHGNRLDRNLYLANRALAESRCRPHCTFKPSAASPARAELIRESLARHPSALTELGRLYLWTIEFGLIGDRREYRVYGAGLLSSVAETRAVCSGRTPILDLSLAAVGLDIRFSDPQSAYFVAPSYLELHRLLTQLEERWSSGGGAGLAARD
jgi:phenylalanine-4-hydroxylase